MSVAYFSLDNLPSPQTNQKYNYMYRVKKEHVTSGHGPLTLEETKYFFACVNGEKIQAGNAFVCSKYPLHISLHNHLGDQAREKRKFTDAEKAIIEADMKLYNIFEEFKTVLDVPLVYDVANVHVPDHIRVILLDCISQIPMT